MAIQCTCPGCGTPCTIAERLHGKKVRCPRCKEVFTAGAEPAAAEERLTVRLAEESQPRNVGQAADLPADDAEADWQPAPRVRPSARSQPLIPPPKPSPSGTVASPQSIPSVAKREITNAAIILGFMVVSTIVMSVVGAFFIPRLKNAVMPAPPVAPAIGAPGNDAELTQVLDDLKSADMTTRTRACERLAKGQPNTPRRGEVAAALAERLGDKNGATHDAAAKALVVWATRDQVQTLLDALDHESGTVRQSALEALGNLKDERAVKPVARRLLQGDRKHASKALQSMGTMAEKEVLTYLQDRDAEVRAEACRVLRRIGTAESVSPLTALKDKDNARNVQIAAADALDEIGRRR